MKEQTVRCPECSKAFVMAKPLRTDHKLKLAGDHTPKKGDFTCCMECTAVLIYAGEGAWRVCTDEEWLELDAEERTFIKKAQDVLRKRKSKEPMDEKEAANILGSLIGRIPDDLMALVPYLMANRMMNDPERDALGTMTGGVSYTIGRIVKRKDSSIADDFKCIIPCLMAIEYIKAKGDLELAKANLLEEIKKNTPEGADLDALRKAGIIP